MDLSIDRKRIIALWLLYRRRMRKERASRRRWWVHPLNQVRPTVGQFQTLFYSLRNDAKKFFNYFRMSVTSYDELLLKIESRIQRQNTYMRDCIQPVQMLAVTIRYLASGCTFTDLSYSYRLGTSTVSQMIGEVCDSIWSVMRPECIPPFTEERWKMVAEQFQERAQFPLCLGAIDGKHIRIQNPLQSSMSSMFFNYKRYHSIVLMAVADADYRFVFVDIGGYGKDCDSSIFQNTTFWNHLQNNELQLPPDGHLPGIDTNLPYLWIADAAFGQHRRIQKSYGGYNLTLKQRIFNYRLSRARRFVECAFGILSNKWRIFHRAINLQPTFAMRIVEACVVLHNFVRDRDGYEFEHTTSILGFEDLPSIDGRKAGRQTSNKTVRDKLADYFMSPNGEVSWQYSKV